MNKLQRCFKDPFPALSHWAGAVLSVLGLVQLLHLAGDRPWHLLSFAIYGASLILLYSASAAAHSIHCSPQNEERLNRIDYIAIFLLIAGTYTPVCLVLLRQSLGWGVFALEWGLAVIGIALILLGGGKWNWPRTLLYLFMGWAGVIALPTILRQLPIEAIAWLLAGGAAYSIGAVIFATNLPRLWPGRFGAHDLWHVLVLVGSACHYAMIAKFVAPVD